jgi:hypothetical protein
MAEYIAFQLWAFMGGPLRPDRDWKPADSMNDAGGAACLFNARGAEGWELVAVVPQHDANARDGTTYVAHMKRRIAG